jgi:hypothetical protein
MSFLRVFGRDCVAIRCAQSWPFLLRAAMELVFLPAHNLKHPESGADGDFRPASEIRW